jgi:hypothetical protein
LLFLVAKYYVVICFVKQNDLLSGERINRDGTRNRLKNGKMAKSYTECK